MDSTSTFSCVTASDDSCRTVSCEEIQALDASEIHKLLSSAVVKVSSEFILVGADVTGTIAAPTYAPIAVTDVTPLSDPTPATDAVPATGGRRDTIIHSNGALFLGNYILTTASAVLMPPSLGAAVNRYPYLTFNNPDVTLGVFKDQMVRASRILVTVYNVNGSGKSFVYDASLIGVDGAGDIAILKINSNAPFNRFNACLKNHPHFEFGKSRALRPGNRVYLLGDYLASVNDSLYVNNSNFNVGIVEGLVTSSRHADHAGWALQDLVTVSAGQIGTAARGMPIVDEFGKLVALQTINSLSVMGTTLNDAAGVNTAYGIDGYIAGPSEFFMRNAIKEIIAGDCSRRRNNVAPICDAAGGYVRYHKAYAGLATDVFEGYMYDITTDFSAGTAFSGQPRVRVGPDGRLLNSPSCKNIVGLRVLGLAGANPNADFLPTALVPTGVPIPNGIYYVPGGDETNFLTPLPISPFLGAINAGDVITHIGRYALGDLHTQIVPTLVTWAKEESSTLDVTVRAGGNANNWTPGLLPTDPIVQTLAESNAITANYDDLEERRVCLADFPAFMDYPWYAILLFPDYEAFVAAYAPTLLDSNNLPGGGNVFFHPAW